MSFGRLAHVVTLQNAMSSLENDSMMMCERFRPATVGVIDLVADSG